MAHRLAQVDWALMFPAVLEVHRGAQRGLAVPAWGRSVLANVVSTATTPMHGRDRRLFDADLADSWKLKTHLAPRLVPTS